MSTEAAVAKATPAQSVLAWEQQKWRDEYQLKTRELDLKQKELDLKREEQERSIWSNPLFLAILAAVFGGMSSVGVAFINGRQQHRIEQSKAAESLRIEESRSEAGRILEMIKTGEPDKAASNLEFLINTGLISNDERVAQIQRYLNTRQPGTGPFLPAADGRYAFEQSEGLTKPVAETLENSLNDFIAYLDRLGLTREAEKVSIKIVKGRDALYPYYKPDEKVFVINQLIAGDVDVPRRAYSHHVLMGGKTIGISLQALEFGLAWYLPCSFAGRPIYGEFSARALKLDRPNIGDISQPFNFEPFTIGEGSSFLFERGAAWASLCWEIRTRLGQQVTDALVIQAWQKTSASSGNATDASSLDATDRSLAKRFDQELLVAAENVPKDARSVISTILKDRGFPL